MSKIADPNGVIQPFDLENVQLLDGFLKSQFDSVRDFYCNIRNDDILKVLSMQEIE